MEITLAEQNYITNNIPHYFFVKEADRLGYRHGHYIDRSSSCPVYFDYLLEKDKGWSVEATGRYGVANSVVFAVHEKRNLLLQLAQFPNHLQASIAGADEAEVVDLADWFEATFPRPETTDEQIAVTFWYITGNGPRAVTRRLDAPSWDDISPNYVPLVREGLSEILTPNWRPSDTGQLILWQGSPGGGKTYAIRALVKAWRHWCSAHYVTDTDAFFKEAAYMMQVILNESEQPALVASDTPQWKLLILEDAGELLGKDARAQTGQALSRLLNITDGLIGQGLRLLVLVTTNEELSELHEAVQRPGRAASRLHFDKFSGKDGAEWLNAQGMRGIEPGSRSLAELYAIKQGTLRVEQKREMGFAVR